MQFYSVLRHFVDTCGHKRANIGVFVRKIHFRKCVQKSCRNRFEINVFCIRFDILCEDKFEKKHPCKKTAILSSNFHFGKCMENTGKNRPEINAFCMRFETLYGDKFKENVQKMAFLSVIFTFAKPWKTRAKTFLR